MRISRTSKLSVEMKIVCLLVLCFAATPSPGQVDFQPVGSMGLPAIVSAEMSWGDFDRDGDLDLALANGTLQIYENRYPEDFAETGIPFPSTDYTSLAWADFDLDGDLDLFAAGLLPDDSARIYFNQDGSFDDHLVVMDRFLDYLIGWTSCGDYDNDGDDDLLISGSTGPSETFTYILRNDTDSFQRDNLPLLPYEGDCHWGDYDGDGDLDILSTGRDGDQLPHTVVLRNNAGTYDDPGANIVDVNGSCMWGDYDDDGDLDILISGQSAGGATTRIYRFNSGAFVLTNAAENLVPGYSCRWFDCDADGDLDLFQHASVIPATFHLNDGGAYTEFGALGPYAHTRIVHGDFDNDQDLDLLTMGRNGPTPICEVYRNDSVQPNQPPTPPTGTDIMTTWDGAAVLKWDGADDPETPSAALTYSVKIGTASGGVDVASPPALPNGLRTIAAPGRPARSYSGIRMVLAPGIYHWSVQAVDHGLAGSPFSTERRYFNHLEPEITGLADSFEGAAHWVDCDLDGDLDVALTGMTSGLFLNSGGVFTDSQTEILAGYYGSSAWGDYDNDGDPDLVVTCGDNATGETILYENQAGALVTVEAGFEDLTRSDVAWGDYDLDGDLDLLLAGYSESDYKYSLLYANDSGAFTPVETDMAGVDFAAVAWVDVDGDDDLDVSIAGRDQDGLPLSRLYLNEDGVLTEQVWTVPDLMYAVLAWGDYDNDADADLFVAGYNGTGEESHVFRNDDGVLVDVGLQLPGFGRSDALWSDFDNDGDLDLVVMGHSDVSFEYVFALVNESGELLPADISIYAVTVAGMDWGDYDGDGDLDLLTAGFANDEDPMTRLYKNTLDNPNAPPTPPANPRHVFAPGDPLRLEWDAAVDDHTPVAGLTYALRIGTTPGGCEIVSPAALASGFRTLMEPGNVGQKTHYEINLPIGTYYWSLQAVDQAFAGSAFTEEQTVLVVPAFEDVGAELPDLSFSNAAWGDYDADGALDVLLMGSTDTGRLTRIYRNVDGAFHDIGAGLPSVSHGDCAWGDLDNDGDLDVLVTGGTATGRISYVYRNEGGTFVDALADLYPAQSGSADWIDFDQDGDLDILITGSSTYSLISVLYENRDGVFSPLETSLPGVNHGAVDWADYDNDGDMDLAITGYTGSERVGAVYRNDGGVLVDAELDLLPVNLSSVAWGDYDGDGDPDLALSGSTDDGATTKIYENEGGNLTEIDAGGLASAIGTMSWGDSDNDGDLDLAVVGFTSTWIFRNEDGVFVDIEADLDGASSGKAAWGDYDNDGGLDLLLTGRSRTLIYKVHADRTNTPPTPPAGLAATATVAQHVAFTWTPGADAESATAALTYNLRVGTTPGGIDISSPMSSETGGRFVAAPGAAGQSGDWHLTLPIDTYYWSVQAIDDSFVGSTFAPEAVVVFPPEDVNAEAVDADHINVNWSFSPGDADSFTVRRRLDGEADFTRIGFVTGTQSAYVDEDVEPLTMYDYRIVAWVAGYGSVPSDSAGDTTGDVGPGAPTGFTAAVGSETTIDLAWTDASGNEDGFYIYRRVPSSSEHALTDSTNAGVEAFTDQDLTPGSTYSYQIAAFNAIGTSSRSAPAEATTQPNAYPVVELGTQPSGQGGSDCVVRAVATDDQDVVAVGLHYRRGGTTAWTTLAMSLWSATIWEATIPGADLTPFGIQFYIEARDQYDQASRLPLGAPDVLADLPVSIENHPVFSLMPETYKLAAVPLVPDTASPTAAFAVLGVCDDSDWRFGVWDPHLGDYLACGEAGDLLPGRGFWIISRDAQDLRLDGTSCPLDHGWDIILEEGFNQIGNPFSFSVAWSDLEIDASVVQYLYAWNGSGYDGYSHDTLLPGRGYWVEALADGATITVPPVAATAKNAAPGPAPAVFADDEDGWCVSLSAADGDSWNSSVRFGQRSDATAGRDACDLRTPPPPPDALPDFGLVDDAGQIFMTDFRSRDTEGETWRLVLRVPQPGREIGMTYRVVRELPEGWRLISVDESDLRETDLSDGVGQTVLADPAGGERAWRLIAGTDAYVAEARTALAEVIAAEITSVELYPGRPNPFVSRHGASVSYSLPTRSQVSIRIHDLRGRVIRTLVDGTEGPGQRRIDWYGRDDEGRSVATGVYFVRLTVPGEAHIEKLSVIR